ncbi:hypothetical protein ACGF4C_37795 [Streptomyces sp. NPDC048197]
MTALPKYLTSLAEKVCKGWCVVEFVKVVKGTDSRPHIPGEETPRLLSG